MSEPGAGTSSPGSRSVTGRVCDAVTGLSWVQRSLIAGAVLTVLWMSWDLRGLDGRVLRDGLIFFVGPVVLAVTHRRRLGFRVDRLAVRNTVLLAAFVLPFYLVGSSLPSVRAFYPMWYGGGMAFEFLPHTAKQFVLVLAAETYYRGLLCVGVREIGFKSVFISPLLYAFHHAGKPPIELLLSGPTDVLFGAADFKSNSILPSVVAHGLGLAFLDWLVLRPPVLDPVRVVSWFSWLPVPI